MKCIICGGNNTTVIDTRELHPVRRRRYKCCDCGSRFSTLEGYLDDALFRDGSWLSVDHMSLVATQMEEGAAELKALAKRFKNRVPKDDS